MQTLARFVKVGNEVRRPHGWYGVVAEVEGEDNKPRTLTIEDRGTFYVETYDHDARLEVA